MIEQIDYIRHMDLGFSKENLLVIRGDFFPDPQLSRVLMEEFERDPSIEATSGSLSMPTLKGIYDRTFKSDEQTDVKVLSVMYVADKYDQVLDFKQLSGNFFSPGVNDSLNVVLNEAAVKLLDIKDPVGKTITYIEQTYGTGEQTTFKIIGVVKDFNFQTVHSEIRPLVLHSTEINYNRMSYIVCKIQPKRYAEAISFINSKWKQFHPGKWFQYGFLEDELDSHYKKEEAQIKIIMLFGAVSLFISCIGLFGLSAFVAKTRLKEIGIRKAIGATSLEITLLLLSNITKNVLVGFVIAIPAAAYVVNEFWLNSFAFRAEPQMLPVAMVGVGALAIAWATVFYHTYTASIQNPVDVLRTE
jgi:putative ABC transport system permease protein